MIFENRTKETIKVRVVEKTRNNLHGWRNVKPEKTIDLEKGYGLRVGLTPVNAPKPKETLEDPKEEIKETPEEPNTEEPEPEKKKKRGRRRL